MENVWALDSFCSLLLSFSGLDKESEPKSFVGKTSQLETFVADAPLAIPGSLLNPFYVTGLSEGESTFTYIRNGNGFNLRFAVKLTETDRNLIFALQGFFGTGQVYHVGAQQPSQAAWMYCVTSVENLEKIVSHFDTFPLLGKKRDEYAVWKQMYEIKKNRRKPEQVLLASLAEKLSSMRTKGRRYLKINRWSAND
jgi:hypothetical protein